MAERAPSERVVRPSPSRGGGAAFARRRGSGFAALVAVSNLPAPSKAQQPADPLAALKAKFARPAFVPTPADNLPTAAQGRAGQAAVRGPGVVLDRDYCVRHLP